MVEDPRSWQDESTEDLSLAEREWNPIAQLGAELVLVQDAIQQNLGTFCTSCTCMLGFHLICDDGACESCGCDEIRKYCLSCGKDWPLEKFEAGSTECQYCLITPPIKIRPSKDPNKRQQCEYGDRAISLSSYIHYDREKEARAALRELSE